MRTFDNANPNGVADTKLEDRMTDRTWEQNADAFAELDRGEGWPFAALVACSVVKRGSSIEDSGKVYAEEFSRRAGTSGDRVLRYLKAWDAAATADRDVTPSGDLIPADIATVIYPTALFGSVYDARTSPKQEASRVASKLRRPEVAAEAMEDAEVLGAVLNTPAAIDEINRRAAAEREAENIRHQEALEEAERKAEARGRKAGLAEAGLADDLASQTPRLKAEQDEVDQNVPPVSGDLMVIVSEQLDPVIRRLQQAAEKYPSQLHGLAGEAFAEILQERIAKLADLVPCTVPDHL